MSTFKDLFETDPDLSENGFEMEYGVNDKGDDIVFIVAEAGNQTHEKIQRRKAKALDRARGNPDLTRKISCEIVADSILKSWRGVLDDKGKEVPPTRDNKIDALFTYKRLFMDIMDAATDIRNYKAKEDENLGEDYVPTSVGTSKTAKASNGSSN